MGRDRCIASKPRLIIRIMGVGFTEALAAELSGTGIRVWAVCPGLTDTAMATKTGVSPRERAGLIRPQTVARVILELATGRRHEPSGRAVDATR